MESRAHLRSGDRALRSAASIVRWRRDLAKISACVILSFRSWTWMLGYPEAALADADHAIKGCAGDGQAATLIYALRHIGNP